MENEQLISVKAAALMLGVHEQTLREWDNAGKLVAIKTPGGHRRYKTSELNQIINNKGWK